MRGNEGAPERAAAIDHRLPGHELPATLVRNERLSECPAHAELLFAAWITGS
jgi:hypothetical protein